MREITFSAPRALESILYASRRVLAPTMHEVLKLRYFADKLHLSRYGFTASGDDYKAMEFGPVGSGAYDLLKAARGVRNNFIPPSYVALVADALRVEESADAYVIPLREANTDYLSAAELECLDEAIEKWGNLPFDVRTKLSHDAAYDKAWARAENSPIQPTDIAATLQNAEDVLEYMAA